jgi:hypothetical protein
VFERGNLGLIDGKRGSCGRLYSTSLERLKAILHEIIDFINGFFRCFIASVGGDKNDHVVLRHDADIGDPMAVAAGMSKNPWHSVRLELSAPAQRVDFRHRCVQPAVGRSFQQFSVTVRAVELILRKQHPIPHGNVDGSRRAEHRRNVKYGLR